VRSNDDELYDPLVQARDPADVQRLALEGIAESWSRVWDLPLPFYRGKFESAGLRRDELPDLDEIPRTTKSELRADEEAHPPSGSYRAVALEDAVRIGSSGGTTGRPTLYFYGPGDLEAHISVVTRNLWRHGLRAGMRFTHSWPQGIYPSALGGGRSYLELSILEIPVGPPFSREVAAEHLRLWQTLRPNGFMMTGSQLQIYQQASEDIGEELAGLLSGGIIAFLEASCQFELPRRRIEDYFGVRIRNIGGASDIPGFAVTDCGHHTGMHVASDHFVIQVCDPLTGREVPAGERGTLVVTAFGLDAVAIRYDVEDLVVESQGSCPCGETGGRYTLLGRVADSLQVGGRTVLPLDIQLALDGMERPPEFQMLGADDGGRIRLRVEGTGEDGPRVADYIRQALDIEADVELVDAGSLPRASFKPRRVAG
jgi:phenylacetate-CoA ligase